MEMLPALNKSDLDSNPIKQFAKWYDEVIAQGVSEQDATSMTLATAKTSNETPPVVRRPLLLQRHARHGVR